VKAAKKSAARKAKSSSKAAPAPLQTFRDRIDTIDEQIHGLLNERAKIAQEVGVSKAAQG
jgi:chorismate mutase